MEDREAIRRDMMKEVISRMNEGDERTEVLDEMTLRAMEIGIQAKNDGPDYSWEEAKQFIRERRKIWMNVPDSLSA